MADRLNVLVVGCGNIAGGFDAARPADAPPLTHAGAFQRHPGFRVSACVEPDTARRAAFMRRWDVPFGADTVAALPPEAGPFDLVSLCSPTALHAEHLHAALALRPRLVFCEKPLAPTLAEAEALVQRCRDTGVALAVNHNRRWDPVLADVAQALHAGRWGALRSVHATYNKGVLNNGSHLVDLLHRVVGPLQVDAVGAPRWDHWPDDPTVEALLRTSDGTPVHLVAADARDYALFELTLVTAEGVLTMEDGGLAWRIRRRVPSPHFPGYHSLDTGTRLEGGYAHTMTHAVDNLHAALTAGAALASDGASALQAQRFCAALRDAALAREPGRAIHAPFHFPASVSHDAPTEASCP